MNHKEEIRESHNIHVKVTCGKGKSACFILSLGLNLRGRNPHKYIYLKTKQNSLVFLEDAKGTNSLF